MTNQEYRELQNSFKIGDRVLVTNRMGSTGTVVTKPVVMLGVVHYGIKFDNPDMNTLYDPFYIAKELLMKIDEHIRIKEVD